ncbi:4564_t:CDS:1, partial [Dentiscutata erythropus]
TALRAAVSAARSELFRDEQKAKEGYGSQPARKKNIVGGNN